MHADMPLYYTLCGTFCKAWLLSHLFRETISSYIFERGKILNFFPAALQRILQWLEDKLRERSIKYKLRGISNMTGAEAGQ